MNNPHPVSCEMLIAYAAKELGGDESSAVAAHVAGCTECTTKLVRFLSVRMDVRSDDTVDIPSATLERVLRLFCVRQVSFFPGPRGAEVTN